MGIPKLPNTMSLEAQADECVYTEARLLADPRASRHAKRLAATRKQALTLRDARDECWANETRAQAAVDAVDDALDDLIARLANELAYADGGKRTGARYKLYFKRAPSEMISLGLASAREAVGGWLTPLASEPEASFKDMARTLKSLLSRAEKVLKAREAALVKTATFRARELLPFVDGHNRSRQAVHADLSVYAAASRDVTANWPDSFFRHNRGRQTGEVVPAAPPSRDDSSAAPTD